MKKLDNKLLADYDSKHIVMVYPIMHDKFHYYEDIKDIYLKLSNIMSDNKISQSYIVPEDYHDEDNFFKNLSPEIEIIKYNCNDIWIRDYYPKLYRTKEGKSIISFDYNGYGEKYEYKKDNNYKYTLDEYNCEFDLKGFVVEGGNLEFSSKGVVLTNQSSFTKNNNKHSRDEILNTLVLLKKLIPFNELFTLELDPIRGDDTNGHIDNMVRFLDDENIVYLASRDKSYINYNLADELRKQLESIKRKSKIIKNIFPIYHDDRDTFYYKNKFYPYSKLNFLITEKCIVFPSIRENQSSIIESINYLPINRKKYTINCEASLLENGGLHCLSMNI